VTLSRYERNRHWDRIKIVLNPSNQ
jgi:hypothetical protein